MTLIQFSENGTTAQKEFADNKKGTDASVRFIKELYEKRTKHPWYFNLQKIESIEAKLKGYTIRRGKQRYQLESELRALKKSREELLELLGITAAPPLIKLEIKRI